MKMDTLVELWHLVLDLLNYSIKGESPINRSAKAVISRNLNTSRHNYFFFFPIFFYSFILFFICLQKTDFRVELFVFPMDTLCLLIRAISGLIAVENNSGVVTCSSNSLRFSTNSRMN